MTRHPALYIQSTDVCPSTNPSTSTCESKPRRAAQSHIIRTASNSPSDTRAEATSMRSTFKSSSAVDLQVLEKQTRNHQLLVRDERHSAGLFPIPECRIHDFYTRMFIHNRLILFGTQMTQIEQMTAD